MTAPFTRTGWATGQNHPQQIRQSWKKTQMIDRRKKKQPGKPFIWASRALFCQNRPIFCKLCAISPAAGIRARGRSRSRTPAHGAPQIRSQGGILLQAAGAAADPEHRQQLPGPADPAQLRVRSGHMNHRKSMIHKTFKKRLQFKTRLCIMREKKRTAAAVANR